MQRKPARIMAALLVAAVLSVPGGALASEMPLAAPPEKGASAPATEGGALVAPKLSREEAIAAARTYFQIPAALGEPNVGIRQGRESASWSLEWATSGKAPDQVRISVSVDAVSGQIVSYAAWSSQAAEVAQLSFTREEAKAKAQEWFAKLVPAEMQPSLRPIDSPLNAGYWGGASYQFAWQREIKGYLSSLGGVYITIDARSGQLSEFGMNPARGGDYTLPEKVLTQAEAEALYREKVPMLLQYQRFTKRGTDQGEWRLVYRPLTDSFPMMNQEGTPLDWQGDKIDVAALMNVRKVPASEKLYQRPAAPLGSDEALAVARAVTGRADAPLSSSYSEYGDEIKRKAWDLTWLVEQQGDRPRTETRVRVDAETGLVTEFSNWSELKPLTKEEPVPFSQAQAEEKAIGFLRAHRPDLAGNLQLRPQQPDKWAMADPTYQPVEYYISFQFLKDGVPVTGRDFSISVSAQTGEIRHFWSGYFEAKASEPFPKAVPAISAATSMEIFLKEQGIKPTWVTLWSPREGAEQSPPVLAWQQAPHLGILAIDAHTGAPLDHEGRNLIEAQRYPSDIKGHWAEREIELLWARGVFDLVDGTFNPNQSISADELARWIVLARGLRPYMAYDFTMAAETAPRAAAQAKLSTNSAYFGAAFQNGIILPEEIEGLGDINGPVSRELFGLWAARAMGYAKIVKMNAQIAMSFEDQAQVGPTYRNAVALLAGLGVVSGHGGQFRPQAKLTRAEAVKILFALSGR